MINKRIQRIMLLSAVLLSLSVVLFGCKAETPDSNLPPSDTVARLSESAADASEGKETGTASDDSTGTEKPQEPAAESAADIVYNTSRRWGYGFWKGQGKYTQADYDLALSFKTEGFEEKSVEEFDRSVMNWEDEDAYHKTEEALQRLFMSLSREDQNAGFIFTTLSNTWDACEKKHYSTCRLEQSPWHSGYAEYETYGDVYGDKVFLSGAYADYDFDYQITDEKTLTVGRRDALLDSVKSGLADYMKEQSVKKLKNEKTMEKELTVLLEQSLKEMDPAVKWGGHCGLSYDWEAPYDWEPYDEDFDYEQPREEEPEPTESYIKSQYEYFLQGLQFDRHKDMPVAEFNRMVHAAFYEEENDGKLLDAYDCVMSYLSGDDTNSSFFNITVPAALEEYETRARTVYTGTPVDPSYSAWLRVERTEDVYGDELPVGEIEANFSFTYRILDADRLTVGERDQFLNGVVAGAKEYLKEAMKKGGAAENGVDKSTVEKALRDAGKRAGSALISFTGCEIDDVEDYQ